MKETIFEFYRQYAPDVKITDDKINEIETYYRGDVNRFINDFKKKVTDPKGITLDRQESAAIGARIYRAYEEADVDAVIENEETERRLQTKEKVKVDPDIDPTELLDNFYDGTKTLTQDYHHVKQLLSPYGFKVKKGNSYSETEKRLMEAGNVMNAQFNVEGKRSLIITAPNGKEQTILLDPTDQNKNKEILTEFFNANVDRDSDAFKKGQSKIRSVYSEIGRDYYDAVKLTDAEEDAVIASAKEVNLFEVQTSRMPGTAPGTQVTTTYMPYKEIIQQAKLYLADKEDNKNPTNEDIERIARQLYTRKALFDKRAAKGDKYLSDIGKTEIFSSSTGLPVFDSEADLEKQAQVYIGGKALESSAAKNLESRIETVDLLNQNFDADPDVVALNTLLDKYDEHENSQQMMYSMNDGDRERLRVLSERVSGKIFDIDAESRNILSSIDYVENTSEQLEVARKSFNMTKRWFDKFDQATDRTINDLWTFWGRTASDVDMILTAASKASKDGGESLEKTLFEGGEQNSDWFKKTFPSLSDESINKFNIERQKQYQKIEGKYREGVKDIGTAFQKGRVGELAFDMIADFLPIVGTIALTSFAGPLTGAARFGSMMGLGGGARRSEYDFDEYINPTAGKTSLAQKMFISAGHGLAEYAGERLTTFKLVDNMISPRGLPRIGSDEVIKALAPTGRKYLQKNFLSAVPLAFGAEGLGESATQVMQNVLDKRPIMEGVPTAFFGGMIMGGGMGIASTLHGAAIASTVDSKTRDGLTKQYEGFHNEVSRLDDLRRRQNDFKSRTGIDSKKYDELIEAQKKKVQESADALDKQYKILIPELPAFNKAILGQIMRQEALINQKRLEYEALEKQYKDGEITAAELDTRKLEIEVELAKEDGLIAHLDAIKSGKLNQFKLLKDSKDKQNEDKYDQYIDAAKAEGVENVEARAEEMFYEDLHDSQVLVYKKIAKEHNKKKGRRYDMEVKSMTKEQAIERIKESDKTEAEKAEIIRNIREGKQNGIQLDSTNSNGQNIRTAISIKENAVKNRRAYTMPHEVIHAVVDDALTFDSSKGVDTAREAEISDAIKEYTKNALPDIYEQIKDQSQVEVIPMFFEYFLANKHKVKDHAAFFGGFAGAVVPQIDFNNAAELLRYFDSFVQYNQKRSSLEKARRAEPKFSLQEDPKGFARRRDKMNNAVERIMQNYRDSRVGREEDELVDDFVWNEEIAAEVLAFAIENKILDTYILGKRPMGISPTQWINDVYTEFISVSNNYDGRIKDADGRADYFGWLMGNLGYQALDVTKSVIKEQQQRAKTVDIDEARGIAAEIGDTVEDFGFTEVAEKLGVPVETIKELTKLVQGELGRFTKDITEGVTLNRSISPLFQTLNARFAQATAKNPGGGNWRVIAPLLKDLKSFIENNTATMLNEVSTEYAAKNIPQIVQKSVNGEFISDWQGKKIDRQSKADTGKTSGPQIMRKDKQGIRNLIRNPQALLDIFLPNNKPSQAKKEGLAINLSQRLAREILQNDLLNYIKTGSFKNSPIAERLAKTQSLFDRVISEAKAAEIVRQSDRIKNSVETLAPPDRIKVFEVNDQIVELIRKGVDVEAAVRQLLRFGDKKMLQVAKAYSSVIAKYGDFTKLAKAERSKIKPGVVTLEDFIQQEFADIVSDDLMFGKYVDKIANLEKDLNAYHLEDGRVETARKTDKKFIKSLMKEFNNDPKEVAKFVLKFMKGHTASASQISNKAFGIIDGILSIIDKDRVGARSRFQNYQNVDEMLNTLLRDNLGMQITKVNKLGKREGGYEITYEGQDVFLGNSEIKLNPIESKAVIKNNITYDQSKTEADEQTAAMFKYLDFLNKQRGNNYDDIDFILALQSLNSNMQTMLRRSAPYTYKFVGDYTGALRYEHIIPAGYILTNIADHYLNKGKTKADLKKLMSKYEVAIIPETMDKQIPMGSLMARGYQAGDNALANRYYTIANFGKDNFYPVKNINNGDVFGDVFSKKSLQRLNIRAKNSVEKRSDSKAAQHFVVAMKKSIDPNAKQKGASVIDFDDTLAKTTSKVLYTLPNGTKGKIDATEFATRSEALEAKGADFDFSEFTKVKAGKRGPFFGKAQALKDKFGNTDIFVLTARPQDAAPAIQKFLSGIGLDLKIENIIGLENGTPQAKADWITSKVAEGYNDILFADDAIKNVKAVANVLDMFNIGGKIYQARQKFSKEGSTEKTLDKILDENNPDSDVAGRTVDETEAREKGRPGFWLKELFNFRSKINQIFIPPSAEDLKGLWDNHIAGKGRKGESDKVWFEETILRPYARAERALDRIKLAIRDGMVNLKKMYGKDFVQDLYKDAMPEFTRMDAARIYLWWRAGHDIPGVTTEQFDKLLDYVMKDQQLKNYADNVFELLNDNIKPALVPLFELYPPPTQYWKQQDINSDVEFVFKFIRPSIHQEFIDNRYNVFTPEMMNKIQAIYGTQFREALDDIFFRMEEGVNRNASQINNPWIKWLNFATGNIMFVNIRSALLQSISATNFIEVTGPNNLFNTLARVMDRKQWVADFTALWNSEFLRNRRGRGKIDIVQEEIQRTVASEKDPFLRLASILQNKGYAPTRFMDSLAIAFGGAAYYRNLINDYVSKGMDQVQAERTAMRDFREKAEASQQSARADLISMQQASVMGRIFLTFQNVTMQYTRLGKKALNDFKNGRRVKNADGTFKSLRDSRLEQAWQMFQFMAYQNLLFAGLQKAIILMFALGEGEEVEEKQKIDYLNAALDSILRGSGIVGGILSVVKNIGIEIARGNRRNLDVKVLEISPTISTKFRKAAKIINAIGKGNYKDLLIETPSFIYGLPTDRIERLIRQIEAGVDLHDQGYKSYERILMSLGWSTYDFGLAKPPTVLDILDLSEKTTKKPKGRGGRKGRTGRKNR